MARASSSGRSSHRDLRKRHTDLRAARTSGWIHRGIKDGPRQGPGRLDSSGTSGFVRNIGRAKGWAPGQSGRDSPWQLELGRSSGRGSGSGHLPGMGLTALSLSGSLIVRSPHVRECSGGLGGCSGAWGRFPSLGSGAILYLFSLLLLSLSSRLFSNIASPHLSATPSQSSRLTKQGKYSS